MTTPAEQEAERLAYETFPNPPENVRTHILGDLIGKRAALSVGFVAGAAFERERLRELLEAAREYRDACDKVRDARAFTDEWYAAAGVRDDAEDRLLAAAAALEEA